MNLLTAVSTLMLATVQLTAVAQVVTTDSDDEAIRINPDLTPAAEVNADYADYPWLDMDRNHIDMNGADWSLLGDKLSRVDCRPFRIVLIGDSHIQADGATSVVRDNLHRHYGSAGRGLVTPLRLAGTNEPRDYTITSTCRNWSASRLVPLRPGREIMFTGVAVCSPDSIYDLTVSTTECAFSLIKLYHIGTAPLPVAVTDSDGNDMDFDTEYFDDGYVDILLEHPVNSATLYFESDTGGISYLGGLELLGNDNGVEFSSIGNNGATYRSYLGVDTGRGLARMEADLVILSLGTNDAWGTMSDADFMSSVDGLVNEIMRENPAVKILITTPCEAQKTSRRNRRRGRRTFAPHAKVGHFRNLLLDYGRRHSIPVYDFYGVAGGDNSSVRWIDAGLFSRDRIHLSWTGYSLMGRLMSDALIECLDATIDTCITNRPISR